MPLCVASSNDDGDSTCGDHEGDGSESCAHEDGSKVSVTGCRETYKGFLSPSVRCGIGHELVLGVCEEVRVKVYAASCKVFGRGVCPTCEERAPSAYAGAVSQGASVGDAEGIASIELILCEEGVREGYFGIEKREGIRGERRDNLREGVSPKPGAEVRPELGCVKTYG